MNVVLDRLLTQVDHVAGEKWFAVDLEVGLIGIKETVQPRQKLLGAVVGVKNDGDTVGWCDAADVVGSSDSSSNGSFLVAVRNTLYCCCQSLLVSPSSAGDLPYLSGEVCSATLGRLDDDWGLRIASSLQGCYDGR